MKHAKSLVILGCALAGACEHPTGTHGAPPAITLQTVTPTPLATDDFNRPDETPLGGNWTSGPASFTDLQLAANQVRGMASGGDGLAYYHAASWPADQWSEVRIAGLASGADGGVAVRAAAGTQTAYVFAAFGSGGLYVVGKFVNGGFTELASGGQSFAVGDLLRLEAQGTTLRAYRNGTLLATITDASIAAGHAGIFVYSNNTGLTFDDWSGGGFSGSPPPPAPPAAPGSLVATAVSSSQIDLTWTDNATTEDGFRIERCAGSGCSTFTEVATVGANTVSYQNTGLTAATSYSYRVRAYNAAGASAYSNTATATTPSSPPPPSGGTLATDDFNRADQTPLAGSWTSGPSGFTDLQLASNRVRGVTSGGDGLAYYHAVTWPNDQWSEARIAGLAAGADGGVAVRAAAGAQTAYVFAAYGSGNYYVIGKFVNGVFSELAGGAQSFSVGDVLRLEARGDTIRAYRNGALLRSLRDGSIGSGHAGLFIHSNNAGLTFDDWAGGAPGSTPPPPPPPAPPAAPSNLSATAVSPNQINLSWSDNASNEQGFRIERCAGAGCGAFTEIATVGANAGSYQNTGLTQSTTYSYRVRAYNADGNSSYSNTATATTSTPPSVQDKLPDLGMARLSDFSIQSTSGRKLLRFSTTIVNVGSGKFELRYHRSSTSQPMEVDQRIFDDQGGWRDVVTSAVTELGGDGHNHWHIRDLQLSELFRLSDGGYLARAQKTGFCFWDNVKYDLSLPGAPGSAQYHESGCGSSSTLNTTTGLSIGWGDIYPASLPDQYIEITGLPDGRYRLQVTADPANWFQEASDGNNLTWADLEVYNNGTRVRVLSYGPAAMVASR